MKSMAPAAAAAGLAIFAGVATAAPGGSLPHGLMDGHVPLEAVQLGTKSKPAANTVGMSPATRTTWEPPPPRSNLPPQGACCVGGACSYVSEHDCLLMGGTYLGDFVS